jgi:putative endonuclease
MFYVYVLQSEKDRKLYIGYTEDLKERLFYHNSGKVKSTKNRRPLKIIYYEAYINKLDAMARERHLKTHQQRNFLKERIKNTLLAT